MNPISRRTALSSLLIASAASAAVASAAAIGVPAAADIPATSHRMADLIADFVRLSAALDVAEHSADLIAWDRAAEARAPALEALVFERPETLIDYTAKMTALAQFMAEEDSELFAFRRLAEDAATLAGRI